MTTPYSFSSILNNQTTLTVFVTFSTINSLQIPELNYNVELPGIINLHKILQSNEQVISHILTNAQNEQINKSNIIKTSKQENKSIFLEKVMHFCPTITPSVESSL